MSSFKTFNGYEVEDASARESVGVLGKITPAIGIVRGTGVTITDSVEGVAIDFDVYGRSTQDGEPNPDYPQAIKSVGDMGYFDGELLTGVYSTSNGIYGSNANYLCNKNPIPCNASDDVAFTYHTDTQYNLMILFYDEDMNYLSYKNTNTSDTLTATAPTNASYCNFNIGYGSALSVANASPITVTINDKYALIVDSHDKNFLENIATDSTSNGITVTVNDNKSINIKGTANVQSSVSKWVEVFNKTLPRGSYILSGSPSDASSNSYSFYINIGSSSGVIISSDYTFTLTEDTTVKVQLRIPLLGQTIDATFYPMIRPLGTDDTYEPYKESVKYIPISAPLRGIGEVTDVAILSECKVERKYTKVVFDGSDDEGWVANSDISIFYIVIDNVKILQSCLCDHYSNMYTNSIGYLCVNASDTGCTTLAEFKAQLQANPITVIYELAEPTTESIEPIEIVTYDNVTQISVSDNAGCKVSYYRNNEDGKKMQELDNRMVTAEDTINNLESNAVAVAGDIEDIKTSLSENPLLVSLAPTDELPTIVAGSNVGSFKDTWLNRVINDYEYLIIVIRHRNGSKQIVQIPSMLIEIGGTYTFPFNDVQNIINGAYITINSATRYGIGIFGTLPSDISFELYKYGKPISVG